MTEYTVDTDRLDELADELTRRQKRIHDEHDRLAATSTRLAARWSGEARDRFTEAHTEWSRRLRHQLDALAHSAALTREAATTYRETDAAVADLFS
jgi:WXG100 family type VII secretion target